MSTKRRSGPVAPSAGYEKDDVPRRFPLHRGPRVSPEQWSPRCSSSDSGASFFTKEHQWKPSGITMGPFCQAPEISKAVDMSKVPRKLANLQRSPEHKAQTGQVWNTSSSRKHPNIPVPNEIILTDVALNQTPELLLTTSQSANKRSNITAKKSSNISYIHARSGHRCSHIPNQDDFQESQQHSNRNSSLWGRFFSGICGASLFCFFRNNNRSKTSIDDEEVSQVIREESYQESAPKEEVHDGCTGAHPKSTHKLCSTSAEKTPESLNEKITETKTDLTYFQLHREKEKKETHSSKYFDDIRVFHNIHRREMITKLLYRESGQLYPRGGTLDDPHPPLPPFLLLAGLTPLPPLKRDLEEDPLVTRETRDKIFKKVMNCKPRLQSSIAYDDDSQICLVDDSGFAESCLRAHNLYRARHLAPPLTYSIELSASAQEWANHLAQTARLQYSRRNDIGENIFCRNFFLSLRTREWPPVVTGEEVAAYWYSNVRQYQFNLPSSALHAHAGPFSQMVWLQSEKFGIGKAFSRTGKLVIVAHYYPPGNISGEYLTNVLPLSTRALAVEMLDKDQVQYQNELMQEDAERLESHFRPSPMVSGVLAAQPPNITGRNATKILAAHMLGHAASVITTPEEKLEVVVLPRLSIKRSQKKCPPEWQRTSYKGYLSLPFRESLSISKEPVRGGSLTSSPIFKKLFKSKSLQEVSRKPSPKPLTKATSSILKKRTPDFDTNAETVKHKQRKDVTFRKTPEIMSSKSSVKNIYSSIQRNNSGDDKISQENRNNEVFRPITISNPNMEDNVNESEKIVAQINEIKENEIQEKPCHTSITKPGSQLNQLILTDFEEKDRKNENILDNRNNNISSNNGIEIISSSGLDSLTSITSKSSEFSGDFNSLQSSSYTENSSNIYSIPTSLTEGYNEGQLTDDIYSFADSETDASSSISQSFDSNVMSTSHSTVNRTPVDINSTSTSASSTPVSTPKKCKLRIIKPFDQQRRNSNNSINSINSELVHSSNNQSPTQIEDSSKSFGLNLPFDAPDHESGFFTCAALSPLRY